MADLDAFTIGVIIMIVVIIVIAFLEMKYLRKSMKARRVRASKRIAEMPDDAHNALLTAKAFMESMERGGVRSEEVVSLVRQAQVAYERRNYRVVRDLASQAKDRMMSLKAQQTAKGDLVRLEAMPPGPATEEATTKELLAKEFPPNYAQARFTIDIAREGIAKGRADAKDIAAAEGWLAKAQARFEANDFNAALAAARQAQRGAEGGPVPPAIASAPGVEPMPKPAATTSLACATCGTPLAHDDAFCRRCGTRVGPRRCAACGADLVPDDAFCRKCGEKIAA